MSTWGTLTLAMALRVLLLLLVAPGLALLTPRPSPCNIQCSKSYYGMHCPNLTNEETYNLEISKRNGFVDSSLRISCNHRAKYVNFINHKGCNFTSIKFVEFLRCSIFNVSFGEVFSELGVIPENVSSLSFANQNLRNEEKLESWHLQGLTNLKFLELKENKYTSIPPDIFQATPNLETLIFDSNNMSTLPESLFASTPNLTSVQLFRSALTSLPENIFANLSKLISLGLYGNKMAEIPPKLLSRVSKLRTLSLSFNDITHLASNTFSYLKDLKEVFIKFNNLQSLPEDIFHGCPNLERVHLHNNKLKSLPSALFKESRKLKEFDVRFNEVSEIPQNIFEGLTDLIKLKMLRNSLKKIPAEAFSDLVNLEVLDLQSNLIESLEPGCFDHQRRMDILVLKNNSLTHVPDEIFKNCEFLEKLYLSYNHLTTLRSTSFPHPVTVLKLLDLGNNNISFSLVVRDPSTGLGQVQLEENFPLSDQVNLVDLNLSNNQIKAVPQAFRTNFQNLKNLYLRNNDIDHLEYSDFSFKSDIVSIDLRNNNFETIYMRYFNVLPQKEVYVKLRGNPLVCDCKLYELTRLLQGKTPEEEGVLKLIVVDKINTCSLPDNPNVTVNMLELDIAELTCQQRECPPPCNCLTRPHDHMLIVDCANQELQAIPDLKNYLPEGNYSLTLNLKNNNITSLEGLQSPDYYTLVNLTIPYNKLEQINEAYLPQSLQALDISGNSFTYLCPSLIQFLETTNANLSLGDNPWFCDCQLVNMYTFLRDPLRKLANSHSIVCHNLEKPLLSLTDEELCPTIQQPLVIVTIASTTVFLFLFFVLGTVSVYKYQQDIKVWLFSHQLCLWAVAKEEMSANKKYDAFISYSNKDEDFVNKVLVPGLETGKPRYRVCLHYRDWVPGEYIQNQIDQSIEASHRTIVILSSHFIENVWGQIEFKTAHSKALKEKTNKIIVIVYGQVPPESEMDEELKLYLATRTYLQWDHPKFWEKLRYAMPHPQEFLRKKHTVNRKIENLELAQSHAKPRA